MSPPSLVDGHQRFGENCCPHLQEAEVNYFYTKHGDISFPRNVAIYLPNNSNLDITKFTEWQQKPSVSSANTEIRHWIPPSSTCTDLASRWRETRNTHRTLKEITSVKHLLGTERRWKCGGRDIWVFVDCRSLLECKMNGAGWCSGNTIYLYTGSPRVETRIYYVDFLSSSWIIHRLIEDRFLPNSSQFIVHNDPSMDSIQTNY